MIHVGVSLQNHFGGPSIGELVENVLFFRSVDNFEIGVFAYISIYIIETLDFHCYVFFSAMAF